jgi:predicted metal-dependent phosphoesterase TrpH
MHTAHSDGSCASRKGVRVPCPVFRTLEAAEARGLDFIAITDHNATSQNDALRELAPYFDDLLLIPGGRSPPSRATPTCSALLAH